MNHKSLSQYWFEADRPANLQVALTDKEIGIRHKKAFVQWHFREKHKERKLSQEDRIRCEFCESRVFITDLEF